VLAASLIILFPNIEVIVFSFSLTALASTFYHPPALSATSRVSPSDFTSRGLGFHGASGTLGISLGPITLGLILPWAEWRFVYLIWIIPITAIAVTAFLVKLDRPHHESQHEKKGLATPLSDVFTVTFISFLFLMLFKNAAGGTISTYLTTYLTESKGLDAGLASVILGLSPLIGLTSVLIGGYAGDRLGWKRSFTLTISTATIALSCMFISITTFQTVIAYLIYGFFNIMTMPITSSMVARITPQQSRGTAYSLQFIPMSVIGITMPVILGILINFLEIWIIFPIAITLYIIALAFAQILEIQ
jgi:DHA1 family multidrug resistance protein-like MFS transporter